MKTLKPIRLIPNAVLLLPVLLVPSIVVALPTQSALAQGTGRFVPIVSRSEADVEATSTSQLGDISLPPNAFRSLNQSDIAKFEAVLQTTAQTNNGRISDMEVLAWENKDSPRKKMPQALEAAGYDYHANPSFKQPELGTVTGFGSVNGETKRALLGIWIEDKEHTLLVWGRFTFNKTTEPSAEETVTPEETGTEETAGEEASGEDAYPEQSSVEDGSEENSDEPAVEETAAPARGGSIGAIAAAAKALRQKRSVKPAAGSKTVSTPSAAAAKPPVAEVATLVAKDANDVMRGIAAPKTPMFTKLARKPKTVRGQVKDKNGKPLLGAQIVVQASAAGGFRTSFKALTNAQGIYEVLLPVGVCEIVNADVVVRYNSKRYRLPLHAVDGELDMFDSQKGHIENFVLKTWGVADPEAENSPQTSSYYYGGSIRLFQYSDVPEGQIEVTLTPQGALLDGSAGRTIVVRLRAASLSEAYINDIPLGRYQIRIRSVEENIPLRVKKTFSDGATPQYADSMVVDFQPEGGDLASLGRSGVKLFQISVGLE